MKRIGYFLLIAGLISCQSNNKEADAYGNFEATETMVSAEATGKILQLQVSQGDELQAGQQVGQIDTSQLYLRKQQLMAQMESISSQQANVQAQVAVLKARQATTEKEEARIQAMLKEEAATPQQLDRIQGELTVLERQIQATQTQFTNIAAQKKSMQAQLAQVNDQLDKCRIVNPVDGTVLVKYAEPSEFIATARPLYKIAPLKTMDLRVYVDGSQLPHIQLGQQVRVWVDKNKEENQSFSGTVSWIASQAEFTPKIIQTKKERVDLVYAVKIQVPNDGTLKIGMPAEVQFTEQQAQ